MKGDRQAARFFCPCCLAEEKVWKDGHVTCAACGGVIGWYKRRGE
jgi:hypothetical protein